MAYPQSTFIHTALDPTCFIGRKREVVRKSTLKYQLEALKSTGRYDAFKLKWHPIYNEPPDTWPVPKHLFWDSDIAKWIEGACYFLHESKDPEIEGAIKELVQMIRSASQPDGYLNIHFTVVDPEGRFTNLRDMHELYNAGHLIEAAVAYHELYNDNDLLEPILKYVDLLHETFGPGDHQRHGFPGHPEIEFALLRLYAVTRDEKHRQLAKYFIQERGNPTGQSGRHYYDVEREERGERQYEWPTYYPTESRYRYQQAHLPILEQPTIEGHSVRAMYLLTAASDLVRQSKDMADYKVSLLRLWDNMVDKKMYMTGGIGSVKQWEGFGPDYLLPHGTDEGGCYGETCASIGVMMLAHRLLQLDLNGKYGDIMELCFYNTVLGGMSADGTKFSYTNQLASSDTDLSERADWFQVACCPPNVTRLLGSIGGYLWDYEEDVLSKSVLIKVHMYASGTLTCRLSDGRDIKLKLESTYPWRGELKFELIGQADIETKVVLRIPDFVSEWKYEADDLKTEQRPKSGYFTIPVQSGGDVAKFTVHLPMVHRLIRPHPYTNQDTVTLARGPLVYCIEDVDNPWTDDHFKASNLPRDIEIQISDSETGESFIGYRVSNAASRINLRAIQTSPAILRSTLLTTHDKVPQELIFIPFYFRANRKGRGHMRVAIRHAHS
ncbi:DUF1680-domain-containing protein [Microthyrium microscopicum]|uniref:DUF1680-domain-containing protein n=1 Tax=Microthyrium microscopicum TaxID=703497 RepID=A0A6A6UKZ7_9PEZI|nr:DUF1680-domain-containing protein [Microthyrium microscopicum]